MSWPAHRGNPEQRSLLRLVLQLCRNLRSPILTIISWQEVYMLASLEKSEVDSKVTLLESLPQNVKVFPKTLQNWSIFSYILGVLKFLEMVAKERSCFLYSHRTSMMYSILKRTGWLLKGAEFRFTSESNFQSVNLRIYLPSAETRLSLFNYFWATIRICENIS